MAPKTAFVTGFTGQDGTFLTRLLLDKGYRVIALVRRVSTEPPHRMRGRFDFSEEIATKWLVLEEGDLLSPASLNRIVGSWQPDEIYNLAAQSHVGISFLQPEFTMASILDGTVNLITALETAHTGIWKMYQASTSEMYGDVIKVPEQGLDENYPFRPNSPYAIAKYAAHQYCRMKRLQGRFISCGILFNHESEIRGGNFVTQKIARAAVQFHIDYQEPLEPVPPIQLGNLSASRDWGYAGDYVEGMWRMLQQDTPDDFVLATGETNSIRSFAVTALDLLGYGIKPQGEGSDEQLIITSYGVYPDESGTPAVVVNPEFYRPNDVNYLIGDATKAKEILGWEPEHKFDVIVKIMVDNAKDEREIQNYER